MNRHARFCLACGGRLRTVTSDGRRVRRCAACGWTFYGNSLPTVAALIVRGRRVLLTRRAHPPRAGTWDLPGGFLEALETPEAGLRRELREELGITIQAATFVGFVMDRYGRDELPLLNIVFRVRARPGPIRVADDVSEARWFALDAVPYRAIGFAAMRRAVRDHARATRPRT